MSRKLDSLKAFHSKWIENVQEVDRETIKKLLTRLFPKFASAFGGSTYGPNWEGTWRKELRICSEEKFPLYFQLAVPKGHISNIEMQSIIALLADRSAFAEKLLELKEERRPDGSTRVSLFLERLQDYTEKEIRKEIIPDVLYVLFDVGDKLLVPQDEQKGLISWGNDVRIGRIMFQLLKRYKSQDERFTILSKIFSEGRALSMIVSETSTFGQQHGKYEGRPKKSELECLIARHHVEKLEKIVLKKIREAASKGNLIGTPKLPHLLYRWRDWDGENIVREWVTKTTVSDQTLIDFLHSFLSKSYRFGMEDRVGTYQWRLDPKSLEPFVDTAELADRCKKIIDSPPKWLHGEKKLAIETFLKWYELRLQGKNPEWDLD